MRIGGASIGGIRQYAFLCALAAFLLHDVFDYSFALIAPFEIEGNVVTAIYVVRNPDKLRRLPVV